MYDREISTEIGEICREMGKLYLRIGALSPACLPTTSVTKLVAGEQKLRNQVESVLATYATSGDWNQDGYLTGRSAIVHETHMSFRSASQLLKRGRLGNDYPCVKTAIDSGCLPTDHLDLLLSLTGEKYREHFDESVELLVQNAKQLSAQHFSVLIQQWKNMVDALLDEPNDTYKSFERRELFLNETLDGSWIIKGQLDAVTGTILNKALGDIIDKIWRDTPPEQRRDVSHSARRADALGYLAQGYVTNSLKAENPESDHNAPFEFSQRSAITADIVIDLVELQSNETTQAFLTHCLEEKAPLTSTHPPQLIEQLLCDATISAPIKDGAGKFTLGRTQRSAPNYLKKQLALARNTCSVDGCTIPASWCDAHHITHWAHGGETSIDNLALLCRRHHTMVHNNKHAPPMIRTG